MKYAILSDIHSNLQALEAVLEICDKEKVSNIICLGDVVGYNANPCECIKLVQERFSHCIQGNHDELGSRYLSFNDSLGWSLDAIRGITYTYSQISAEDKEWLKDLEFFGLIKNRKINFSIGHGIPFPFKGEDPFQYIFLDRAKCLMRSFKSEFECEKAHLGFFGHTHIPTVVKGYKDDPDGYLTSVDMGSYMFEENYGLSEIDLKHVISGNEYMFVNPGSVGQPRGDSPNSFVILDTIKEMLEFKTFEYDIEGAKQAILSAGYHDRLAKRLDPILRLDKMF